MAVLELQFLGDFEVRRDRRALPLPPSKKTRALLAFLFLQGRRIRREYLCELLWEIPDDPRGSLRWSLSKLRRLVDDAANSRIVADRSSVTVDAAGVSIDVLELRGMVAAGLDRLANTELESAVARFRGNFLEGMEFSNFHDFHAWCVVQREQSMRDRIALLGELVRRLTGVPERALPHARALVGLAPYEESYRAMLIRFLNAARQFNEAEEQYHLGLRMLKEGGVSSSGALLAARRAPRIDAPPTREVAAPAPEPSTASTPTGPLLADRHELIGRDEQMSLIMATLDDLARGRRAAMLLLNGAPGIGKSRVLKTALALARERGAFILEASAFESGAIRPFSLWIDALRALDPGIHDQVFGAGDAANRDRLFAGLSELIARESVNRPVVLAFDDVQWCDESSAAALHYVARLNRDRPLLGLLTARDEEIRDNAPMQQALRGMRRDGLMREIDLGPLSGHALAHIIGQQAPGADSERLGRACGGNPLLAIELARAEACGSIAGSLDELIRERLARLGLAVSDVLRWAALLGARIDLSMLAKVSGVDTTAVGAALEVAERQGILRSTELGLAFSHDLITRAVYNDISPLRRQVMHRRAAELLEQNSTHDLASAAELAHHATLSGDNALAARAMVSAGRLCLRFFANDDAQSLARKGLQLTARLSDAQRVCVEIDLHDILLASGPLDDREGAARRYTTLAERALDHGALAAARLGYHMAAYVRWTQGQWAAAREQTLQGLRVVRGRQDEAQIVGMAETAKCLVMIERDISQADAMLSEASTLAARHGFNHPAIAAGLGMLRFHENRLEEAEELFREARTLCKSAGDRVNEYQANEYLVMLSLQRGRLEEARERCQELLALGDKLREGSEEPFARAIAGLCRYAIDDQADQLDAAVADLRVADAKHRLAYVLTRAAMIDCERGRVQGATARATEALRYATLLERPTEMLLANAVLSRDCAATGDKQGAAAFAREVERLCLAGAAAWTQEIRSRLSKKRGRAQLREAS